MSSKRQFHSLIYGTSARLMAALAMAVAFALRMVFLIL